MFIENEDGTAKLICDEKDGSIICFDSITMTVAEVEHVYLQDELCPHIRKRGWQAIPHTTDGGDFDPLDKVYCRKHRK